MPIYEYACAACGHKFEEWQKMSDAPVRTCPKCKKKKVEKMISMTAFQLKGGGWYADLYSSSKPGGKDAGAETKGAEENRKGTGNDSGNANGGGDKGADSGSATAKQDAKQGPNNDAKQGPNKDAKVGAKDAKKKDSPKKSEARAA